MVPILLAAMSLATAAAAPAKVEKRCGWVSNPTPANWSLIDRDGDWTMMVQGGYQADGMEDISDMSSKGWVKTNGWYGYGCGCMKVTVDRSSGRIVKIFSATPLPLAQCRRDKTLPAPVQ